MAISSSSRAHRLRDPPPQLNITYIYGYGFPRKAGGPMHWARYGREGGLEKVVEDLRHYGSKHPTVSHWTPSALLLREAGAEPTSKL